MKSSCLFCLLISVINIFMLILFHACNEEPIGMQPMDSTPPGPVSDVTWKPIPGGAVFKYTLPDDEDLLYVKAVYYLTGDVERETIASLYADSLVIVGFGDTNEHLVNLIAVDRSRNESTPYPETIKPDTPDVLSIAETLELEPDFGGVRASWNNPNRAEVSINVLFKDHNDEFVPLESFYTSRLDGEGYVRGMDTISADFIVYVQDKWNNKSLEKKYTHKPLYETLFDRQKFSRTARTHDAVEFPGYYMSLMWDGRYTEDYCFSTQDGRPETWPHAATMDMGITGKISRIRLYQRINGVQAWIFDIGNVRKFRVYGSANLADLEVDILAEEWSEKWEEAFKDVPLLMDCEYIKPSGLPRGQLSDEDVFVAYNGMDFTCPPGKPPVRYLRFVVTEVWSGGTNFQIGEIEIFGDNRY